MIKIKKGLDLPIAGAPEQRIDDARAVRTVAVLGEDYVGMRPTMAVQVGDRVKRGTVLFTDKKNEGVRFTAPASGTVASINRGEKRVLRSVIIDVDGDEAEPFRSCAPEQVGELDRKAVVDNLVASGLWAAFRTRPFSRIPAIDSAPHSIFVTAMDSNPLAPDVSVIVAAAADDFALGLDVVARLTEGEVYVCAEAGKSMPSGTDGRVSTQEFSGVHPAGLVGTHIHFLDPVSAERTVWHIGCQDVIAVGRLFRNGELSAERVVALGGPGVRAPRLLRTTLGASLDELTAGELDDGEMRVISGSVFTGRTAIGPVAFLGRYHQQVSVLPEERDRRLFGYLTPGVDRHSVFPIYIARLFGRKNLKFSTTSNGSPRGMVPIGTFETVMPLDILATQLLRSLLVSDLETAINLGCLELDEEGPGPVHIRVSREIRIRSRASRSAGCDLQRGLIRCCEGFSTA